MMNGGGQPSMPMHPGRGGQHEMPYSPQHHGPYPPQPYNPHPQHFRQPYYQQPPQQWAYYPNMQPMYRPYPHQHQAMMASPYPMPQIPQSMSPRPGQNIPHHLPSRPPPVIYSPPPPERSIQSLQPTPVLPALINLAPIPQRRVPWYPPLPWYSDSSTPFPPAARKRKRQFAPQSPSLPVELPRRITSTEAISRPISPEFENTPISEFSTTSNNIDSMKPLEDMTVLVQSLPVNMEVMNETPITSQAPSENNSTQPTTPSSTQPPRSAGSTNTVRPAGKLFPIVPVIPNIPGLSKARRKESTSTIGERASSIAPSDRDGASQPEESKISPVKVQSNDDELLNPSQKIPSTAPKSPPKSWADLLKRNPASGSRQTPLTSSIDSTITNGIVASSAQIAEVLKTFSLDVGEDSRLSFIKPRGLKNTGNMCYMNSILQVLLYCTPFYSLLDKIGRNAAQSFRNDTPMLEAMISFIREFPVIDAAKSIEQLRLRLKSSELEQYGTPFTPEFVYDVIRGLPRFSSMRRGHQQDAEEFLGFLLEELHEECVRAMKYSNDQSSKPPPSPSTASEHEGGWLEVGPKQKAANTQSSGQTTVESPITKIFGGSLRSEFRVPGAKTSVTLEPYQSLQLDIGSPRINNIVDALKGLTKSEVIHGDFNSPRGPGVNATKQVFIETLPPVLILHLKRFQYDNTGGTQKIWKNVGYPQELEIPKEVFPQHKRAGYATRGSLPRYKLISIVYHHGKSASNGHYTVDLRRQDGQEWVRLDDTFIQRVKSEDVAEPSNGEHSQVLAAALEQHKRDQSSTSNIYDSVREDQEDAVEGSKGWNHVNGSSHGRSRSRKWTGAVNGSTSRQSSRSTSSASSSRRTPTTTSTKENKVAYILFYQRA